ncbi:MAG: nucleotidyltransferase domain-containing protein [Dehalococcoidia bacterium]|nr:nucleotidyltransferase domain-containing protein [Dehalococcoidia bacterium]
MGTRATEDGVVDRLKSRIGEHLRVETLILFGSHARGVATESSDYDLIVVSPDFEGVAFIRRSARLLPLRERGISYDFLCYTPAEFKKLSAELTVVREAARDGIRII